MPKAESCKPEKLFFLKLIKLGTFKDFFIKKTV